MSCTNSVEQKEQILDQTQESSADITRETLRQ